MSAVPSPSVSLAQTANTVTSASPKVTSVSSWGRVSLAVYTFSLVLVRVQPRNTTALLSSLVLPWVGLVALSVTSRPALYSSSSVGAPEPPLAS